MVAVSGQVGLQDREEFGADGLPLWKRRRIESLRDGFSEAAGDAHDRAATLQALIEDGEPPLSLATCEKVPRISEAAGPSGDYIESRDDLRHVPAALEALDASIGRDRERQEKVIELIEAGEVSHAKRFAECRRKSVQLRCSDEKWWYGGCGSSENYVPISCDSRLCPDCMNRKMGRVASRYAPVVADWNHPTMLRLSLHRRFEPDELERAVDALRGAHGRLRSRKVPPNGDGWSWSEWKRSLRTIGRTDLARRWQKRYVDQGKWIPVDEIIPTGFYGIDIKQGDDGTLNVHMHVLADVPWFPQAALSSVWGELTAAPVVDVRRVDGGEESAVMEVIGYAAKPPEFQSVGDEVQYLQTLKGSKLVQPFGDLHSNTPTAAADLICAECGESPMQWEYEGVVDGEISTVEIATSDGDRPPPEN